MNEAIEIYNALLEAKKSIRTWHGMGMLDPRVEQRMWDIYNSQAPEMKRLNEIIDKYQYIIKPATGSGS